MIIQSINNIAEICARHGINKVVISPGSRNAPLILAFSRHPEIKTFVIPDERVAGYIGLGIAQSSQNPVALICTSGTAATNLYPAVTEAFYQQIPLIVLTADRPPEWHDQQDGQTIRQHNLFGNHIKKHFTFPDTTDHPDLKWYAGRIISEAINISKCPDKGPVHINVPIREPFYPEENEPFDYDTTLKIIFQEEGRLILDEGTKKELSDALRKYERIVILAGQQGRNERMISLFNGNSDRNYVLVGDLVSNTFTIKNVVIHHDIILNNPEEEIRQLSPDLLITFGKSVLSKSLKNFIRNSNPEHWHISPSAEVPDTFRSLTKIIRSEPLDLFRSLLQTLPPSNEFVQHWQRKEQEATTKLETFFPRNSFSEFEAVHIILKNIPSPSVLHLANSMTVRYANLIGIMQKKTIEIFSNRGTSGIDGCVSTALGHALDKGQTQILITGDMAFFYDRNAFWHDYTPDNFKIIVLNNHGGGIFRMIDGPSRQPELGTHFEVQHTLTAKNVAKEYRFDYFCASSGDELMKCLDSFFGSAKTAILEIETSPITNKEVFTTFKKHTK